MDPQKGPEGLTQISYGPGGRGWRAPVVLLGQHAHTRKSEMLSPAGGGWWTGENTGKKQEVWAIAETLINQAIMGGRAGSRPTKAQVQASWQRPNSPASGLLHP